MLTRSILFSRGKLRVRLEPRVGLSARRAFTTATGEAAPEVRTRFAPSPTGMMHVGSLRTALFNYLWAKKNKGSFLLRIEDTDQERIVPGAVENIIESLKWASISPDEGPGNDPKGVGPFVQSQRTALYQKHAEQLLNEGHAYRCFCTSERLDAMRNNAKLRGLQTLYDKFCSRLSQEEINQKLAEGVPHVVRLRVPEGTTTLEDSVVGRVTFNNNFIDDQVLLKSDKFPTYHLANVVDDHYMKITHVIRGEEWLPSTPKHLILYKAFGWKAPQFIHLPLLLNPDRSKMSKRQGDVSVDWYRDQGYLPHGLLNFVALLGWNPGAGDNTEIFFMDQLLAKFSLEHINKGGAVVNRNKLDWINTEHIKLLARDNMDQLIELFKPVIYKNLGAEFQLNATLLRSVLKAACFVDRFSTLPELYQRIVYFFVRPNLTSFEAEFFRKSMHRPHTPAVMQLLIDELTKAEKWDRSATLEIVTNVSKSKKPRGMRKPDAFHCVRYSLTGRRDGLETQLIMELLGKEETLARMKLAQAHLEANPVDVAE